MSLPNPSMDFVPFDTLPASQLDDLVENDQALAAGTGLNDDAIPDSKLIYGKVRQRKGGSATDWTTPGTTNYDYSGTNTFIQVGAATGAGDGVDVTVTFPTPFNQKPIVIAGEMVVVNSNAYIASGTITTTTFKFRELTNGAGGGNTVGWIAIGQ